jgi:hypothetical protein
MEPEGLIKTAGLINQYWLQVNEAPPEIDDLLLPAPRPRVVEGVLC